ncbi:MAG TPA: PrgI family protein [Candidatus Saccharimonadales bacterium]|nr:PrgI family protein [Candidatus Saccharimonadales bacterium]
MSTYKVIQDIEAEDHILGPLTLRQFIFALIAVFFFYISFLLASKGVALLDILFLPPGLFFGFFAIPFGRDQPTEVWALAKLRFFLKPRKRIWNQSGLKELVTITVPRKIERHLTDGLTQYEVESRLKVLANTLDTRGWAVKNSILPQVAMLNASDDSDRLLGMNAFSSDSDNFPDEADVMDDTNSPVAQHFAQMIDESTKARHQQLVSQMSSSDQPQPSANNQWFMPTSTGPAPSPPQQKEPIYAPDVEAGDATEEEAALVSRVKKSQQAHQLESNNLRTLQPISQQATVSDPPKPSVDDNPVVTSPLTDQPDPAILSLANSDDLSVQAIAHEAKRAKGDDTNEDEVVISLH